MKNGLVIILAYLMEAILFILCLPLIFFILPLSGGGTNRVNYPNRREIYPNTIKLGGPFPILEDLPDNTKRDVVTGEIYKVYTFSNLTKSEK